MDEKKTMQLYETIDLPQPSNSVIRRGTYLSASQIAKELRVSLRTITGDLDVIHGYYYTFFGI